MRCAIYCRVSSSQQEEDGTSLVTQEARCREYAAGRGWEVVGVFRDAHTGTQYQERPGLSTLRELVRARAVDIVLCYAVDRLSRHQAHLYILVEELETHDVSLAFVTEDFENTPVGRLIRSARAFAAEIEHEKIRERTTRGKLARVQSGKLLPTGKPLYGYRWRDDQRGQLDIHAPEAVVVRQIYAAHAGGATIRGIVAELAAAGIPSPTGKATWSFTTVRNVLRNPAYAGDAYGWGYNRSKPGYSQRLDLEKAHRLPEGTVPPIIDRPTWQAVQTTLAANQARATRNAQTPEAALLRGGYARCGVCGWTMVHRPHASKVSDYVCGQSRRPRDTRSCDSVPTISAPRLDRIVWEHVRMIMTQPGVIQEALADLQQDTASPDELSGFDARTAEISRTLDRLARRIALTDDDQAAALLLRELEQSTRQQRAVDAEREQLLARQAALHASRRQLLDLDAWRARMAANLDALTWEERRLLMDLLGIRVQVWRHGHDPRWQLSSVVDLSRLPVGDIVSDTTLCGYGSRP
jgi:site-specific DNA recombinase